LQGVFVGFPQSRPATGGERPGKFWGALRMQIGVLREIIPDLDVILMTGSVTAGLWTMATAAVGTIAFSAWTVGLLYRETRASDWVALGVISLIGFWPADQPFVASLDGRLVNIVGICGMAAVYLWQRRGPADLLVAAEKKK